MSSAQAKKYVYRAYRVYLQPCSPEERTTIKRYHDQSLTKFKKHLKRTLKNRDFANFLLV